MPQTVNGTEAAVELANRHAIDLARVEAGSVADVMALLNDLDAHITSKLLSSDLAPGKAEKLLVIQAAADKAISGTYGQIAAQQQQTLAQVAGMESKQGGKMINATLGGIDVFGPVLTERQWTALSKGTAVFGAASGDWWAKQDETLRFRFKQQIQQGYALGESVDEMARRIRGTKANGYKDGIMETSRREAQALVRSSVQTISNEARLAGFKANADVIKGVQWVATLDRRTTPTCRALDGLVWRIEDFEPIGHDKIFPGPVAHWNCRSTQVPITRSWEELSGKPIRALKGKQLQDAMEAKLAEQGMPPGKIATALAAARASMDGQVSASTDFQKWLDTKPPEFVRGLLGPTRAQLWQDGKLTVRDLTDQHNRPLTIAQLDAAISGGGFPVETEGATFTPAVKAPPYEPLTPEPYRKPFTHELAAKQPEYDPDTGEPIPNEQDDLIRSALWKEFKQWDDGSEAAKQIKVAIFDQADLHIVRDQTGRIVGAMSIADNSFGAGTDLEIKTIGSTAKGAGSQLIKVAVDQAKAAGADLTLHSAKGDIDFHISLGFRQSKTDPTLFDANDPITKDAILARIAGSAPESIAAMVNNAEASAKIADIIANPAGKTMLAKAITKLQKAEPDLSPPDLLAKAEGIAAEQAAAASKAKKLNAAKTKLLAGKPPTAAEQAAIDGLTPDEAAGWNAALADAKAAKAAGVESEILAAIKDSKGKVTPEAHPQAHLLSEETITNLKAIAAAEKSAVIVNNLLTKAHTGEDLNEGELKLFAELSDDQKGLIAQAQATAKANIAAKANLDWIAANGHPLQKEAMADLKTSGFSPDADPVGFQGQLNTHVNSLAMHAMVEIATHPAGQTIKHKVLSSILIGKQSGLADLSGSKIVQKLVDVSKQENGPLELLKKVEAQTAAKNEAAAKAKKLNNAKTKLVAGKKPTPAEQAAIDALTDEEAQNFEAAVADAKAAKQGGDPQTTKAVADMTGTGQAYEPLVTQNWISNTSIAKPEKLAVQTAAWGSPDIIGTDPTPATETEIESLAWTHEGKKAMALAASKKGGVLVIAKDSAGQPVGAMNFADTQTTVVVLAIGQNGQTDPTGTYVALLKEAVDYANSSPPKPVLIVGNDDLAVVMKDYPLFKKIDHDYLLQSEHVATTALDLADQVEMGVPAPSAVPQAAKPDPTLTAPDIHATNQSLYVPDPAGLTTIKTLPGSTRPVLAQDPVTGKQWVVKSPDQGGGGEPHLRSEATADTLYREMGAAVPGSAFVVSNGKPYKVAEFIEGAQTLGQWESTASPAERKAVYAKLRQHFVADSLLGNWDVAGQNNDNILVINGEPVRVDNGGSLAFRAQGEPKTAAQWRPEVSELITLRDRSKAAGRTADIFAGITQAEIDQQIVAIVAKRERLVAICRASEGEATASMLRKRIDWLEEQLPAAQRKPQVAAPDEPITHPNIAQAARTRYGTPVLAGATAFEDHEMMVWHETAPDGKKMVKAQTVLTPAASKALVDNLAANGLDITEGTITAQTATATSVPGDTYWPKLLAAAKTIGAHSGDKAYNQATIASFNTAKHDLAAFKQSPALTADQKAMVAHYEKVIADLDNAMATGGAPTEQWTAAAPIPKAAGAAAQTGPQKTITLNGVTVTMAPSDGFSHTRKAIQGGELVDLAQQNHTQGAGRLIVVRSGPVEVKIVPYRDADAKTARSIQGMVRINVEGGHAETAILDGMRALQAVGVDVRPPSPAQRELLYLHKTIHARGDADLAGYRNIMNGTGTDDAKIEAVKKWAEARYGVTLPRDRSGWHRYYNPEGEPPTDGVGHYVYRRWDASPATMKAAEQASRFYHAGQIEDATIGWLTNGGYVTTTTHRLRTGVPMTAGASWTSDINRGGGNYLYTNRIGKTQNAGSGFYFKGDLISRVDLQSHNYDSYGEWEAQNSSNRRRTIEEIRQPTGTGYGTNTGLFKNGMSISDVDVIKTGSQTAANNLIAKLRGLGIDKWPDGRKLTDVITA